MRSWHGSDCMTTCTLRFNRLIALKNIFSRQLPNMPREYIARLVLDRRHRSVAIVRKRRTVVGGITYRPFHAQVACGNPCTPSAVPPQITH